VIVISAVQIHAIVLSFHKFTPRRNDVLYCDNKFHSGVEKISYVDRRSWPRRTDGRRSIALL